MSTTKTSRRFPKNMLATASRTITKRLVNAGSYPDPMTVTIPVFFASVALLGTVDQVNQAFADWKTANIKNGYGENEVPWENPFCEALYVAGADLTQPQFAGVTSKLHDPFDSDEPLSLNTFLEREIENQNVGDWQAMLGCAPEDFGDGNATMGTHQAQGPSSIYDLLGIDPEESDMIAAIYGGDKIDRDSHAQLEQSLYGYSDDELDDEDIDDMYYGDDQIYREQREEQSREPISI